MRRFVSDMNPLVRGLAIVAVVSVVVVVLAVGGFSLWRVWRDQHTFS